LWLVIQPLLLLAVYSLVFGVIFEARGMPAESAIPFPLFFFAGLAVHQAMAEVLMRSATLIRSHSSYVTKVVFPLWLLPVMVVISALVSLLIQLLLLIGAMLVWQVPLSGLLAALPLLLAVYACVLLAAAWLTAGLGVFLPDLSQLMGLFCTALLFLSPVFYATDRLPEMVRDYSFLNPLVWPIESLRGLLFEATAPALISSLFYAVPAAAAAIFSLFLFRRMRSAFNDIL
jgi:lipopolysaccharide transport system permease protein